jgi:hypothetical protein
MSIEAKQTLILRNAFVGLFILFFAALFFLLPNFLNEKQNLSNVKVAELNVDIAKLALEAGGVVKSGTCRSLEKHGLIVVCDVEKLQITKLNVIMDRQGWELRPTKETLNEHKINEFRKLGQCATAEGDLAGQVMSLAIGCTR